MIKVVAFDFYGVFARDQMDEAIDSLADSAQLGAFQTMLGGYYVGDASLSDLNKVLVNAGSRTKIEHHGDRDLNHALLALIKSLHSHDVKSAVVGNMGLDDATWVWQQNTSHGYFDFLVPSCELKSVLPDNKIFRMLESRSNTDASQIIYVSADQAFLDAAASSGIIGVHFNSTDRLAEVLAKLIADASV